MELLREESAELGSLARSSPLAPAPGSGGARSVFVAAAAAELRLQPEMVKSDLGRVLLVCEARAEEVITAAQQPAQPEVTLSAGEWAVCWLTRI